MDAPKLNGIDDENEDQEETSNAQEGKLGFMVDSQPNY